MGCDVYKDFFREVAVKLFVVCESKSLFLSMMEDIIDAVRYPVYLGQGVLTPCLGESKFSKNVW